jgi:hypothetical protein
VAESRIYFPLRSNARMLVGGPSIGRIRQRILRAALLHDQVLLEDGRYDIFAGPTGSQALYWPAPPRMRWQSTRHRSKAQAGQFHIRVRPTEAADDAPFHTIVYSETELAWQPTLIPFKHELQRSFSWVEFGHVGDHPAVKREAESMFNPDRDDPVLRELWPGEFVRNLLIGHTNIDLGMGALLDSAVSYDAAHAPVVLGKLRRGEGALALGDRVLSVVFPGELTWEDVDQLRGSRSAGARRLRDYRAVIREVEEEARQSATALGDLDEAIEHEYGKRLSAAEGRRVGFGGKLVIEAIAIGVGEAAGAAAGGVPLVGGLAGAAAGLAGGEVADKVARPRWIGLHRDLERRTSGAGLRPTRPPRTGAPARSR